MNNKLGVMIFPLCLAVFGSAAAADNTVQEVNGASSEAASDSKGKIALEDRVAIALGYDLAYAINSGLEEMSKLGENIPKDRVVQAVNDYLANPDAIDMAEAEKILNTYYATLQKKEILYNFSQYTGQVHHVRDEVSKCFAQNGIDGYDKCVNGSKGNDYYIPEAEEFSTDLVKSIEVNLYGKDEHVSANGDVKLYSVKLTVDEKTFEQPYTVIYDGFWNPSGEFYWRFDEKSTCYTANLCRKI